MLVHSAIIVWMYCRTGTSVHSCKGFGGEEDSALNRGGESGEQETLLGSPPESPKSSALQAAHLESSVESPTKIAVQHHQKRVVGEQHLPHATMMPPHQLPTERDYLLVVWKRLPATRRLEPAKEPARRKKTPKPTTLLLGNE